jgi:hypothetical protein
MAFEITASAEKTIKSQSFAPGRIIDTGIYDGHFINVYEKLSSNSGAIGMHFDFVSSSGKTGSQTLWHTWDSSASPYMDKDDRPTQATKLIWNIMSLFGLKALREKPNTQIEVRERVNSEWVAVQKRVKMYPELCNKHIGTIWQAQEQAKSFVNPDGSYSKNKDARDAQGQKIWYKGVEFLAVCVAETHQSIAEYLSGSEAKEVEPYVQNLIKKGPRIIQNEKGTAEDRHVDRQAETQQPTAMYKPDDFDDDMPFN